jgi:hypothetical protein
MLVPAGLLDALSAACTHMAAALQQEHLPQAQFAELRHCSASLLSIWRVLVLSRPDFETSNWILDSAALAATAVPAASLAYEGMLRFDSAAVFSGKAGKDAQTKPAVMAADLLMTDVADAFNMIDDIQVSSSTPPGRNSAKQAARIMRSDLVYKLALLLLACDVQQRRKEQRGRSQVQAVARDAGVARLPVPDHHTGKPAVWRVLCGCVLHTVCKLRLAATSSEVDCVDCVIYAVCCLAMCSC